MAFKEHVLPKLFSRKTGHSVFREMMRLQTICAGAFNKLSLD
jgi:hypothetical protein